MSDIIIGLILAGVALGLFFAIVTGKLPGKRNNFAALTSFHDVQPKDRQGAIETIVEKKAGKRWSADETGEGNDGGTQELNRNSHGKPEHNNGTSE